MMRNAGKQRSRPKRWQLKLALIGAIAWLISGIYYTIPLWLYLVEYYPALESATVLTGRVEIEGDLRTTKNRGVAPPKYYIVNETGRHEFFCGFIQFPRVCFSKGLFNNGQATVRLHPLFGALQYEVISTKKYVRTGEPIVKEQPYFPSLSYYRLAFGWSDVLPSLFHLVVAIFLLLYFRAELGKPAQDDPEKRSE